MRKKLSEFRTDRDELEARRDFMRRNGYRFCDIAACNCNSWHRGHAEDRLSEIDFMLADYGVDRNGVTLIDAIRELVLTAGYTND